MSLLKRLCVPLSILATIHVADATTLLNETFADGHRTTQNPPTSLNWFASSASATTTATGSVSLASTTAARHLVGYFPASGYGNPVSLQIGETITVSLNFTFIGTLGAGTGNLMRLGLFNSAGGTQFTADNQNPNPLGTGYGGYVAGITTAPGGSPGAIASQILERNAGTASGALLTNSGAYTTQAEGTAVTDAFSTSVTYFFQLSISRLNATSIQLNSVISGGDLVSDITSSFTDTESVYTQFDTIGFTSYGGTGASGSSLTSFSNIQISQVPEPSALLLGVVGASLLLGFRRKR